MRMCLLMCLAIFCTSLAADAQARDLFVDNVAGDDRLDGTQPRMAGALSGPVRTIGRALHLALPGDRIVIAATDEPYRESITLAGSRNSGDGYQPFVIEGNGATLDGSLPIPPEVWEIVSADVYRFPPERKAHAQLFLDGRPAREREVKRDAYGPPELEPLEWCLFRGQVYFRVEPERTIDDYELSHAVLQTGITLYKVQNVAVVDLVVQGFALDGVNAHEGVRDGLLLSLTCRGNGRSGIAVVNTSQVLIEDCLVGANRTAQLYTEGFSLAEVHDSDLLSERAPAVVQRGGHVVIEGTPYQSDGS